MRDPRSVSYPSSYYDDQWCLKPPLLLWIAVAYLSRTITLPIVMALGHFAGVDSRAIESFHAFWRLDGLVPSLIAAAVLYALCRRVPTASKPVRWIWTHGRVFLAVSASLDAVLALIDWLKETAQIDDPSLLSLTAMAIDLYFLVYVLAARRVRHAFCEFPAA
jgi:hypothetical protein